MISLHRFLARRCRSSLPRRYIHQALAISLALLLFSCSSGIQVSADYSEGSNFASYRTFIWTPDPEPGDQARSIGASEVLLKRIRQSITEVLEEKGLQHLTSKDAADADLFLSYYIAIRQKLEVNDPYYSYDRVRTYEQGSLVIDIIDAKSKEIVWTGTGQTRIRYYPTPQQRRARVDEVVHAILAQFPPSP